MKVWSYIRVHAVIFNRVLRARDFEDTKAKLCFKRLILPPKPLLNVFAEQFHNSLTCNQTQMVSSLYQRTNLQMRSSFHYFPHMNTISNNFQTEQRFVILLLLRSTNRIPQSSMRSMSRVINNEQQVINQLKSTILSSKVSEIAELRILKDFTSIPFENLLAEFHSASLVIKMTGLTTIAAMTFLPLGTKYCCGVLEIFPDPNYFSWNKGYQGLADRFGHQYERLDLSSQRSASSSNGSVVPVDLLHEALSTLILRMVKKRSCFLPEVSQNFF